MTSTKKWSCYTTPPAESLEIFERVRARCPVAHSDEHQGFFMLLNWADVCKAMSEFQIYSSQPQVLRPMLPRKPIPGLEMDPPQHSAWRAIYKAAVTPQSIAAAEPVVRERVREHIAEFVEQGRCDIVSSLCEPVPAEAICHLVGIDEPDKVKAIREAAIAMFAAQGDPDLFGRRQAAFATVAVSEVRARRAMPRDDFLSRLASMEVEGRGLDDDDYVVLMAAFLGAGHHSTTSAMASLVLEVFSRADIRQDLLAHRENIPLAVEEGLRLHPPFFGFYRRTTQKTEIGNTPMPEGQDVYMGWAAANRDPAVHDNPAVFDYKRANLKHLSFGLGIHSCPGASLARMELRVLMEELLDAIPDMTIEGEVPAYKFGGGDYSFLPQLQVAFAPRSRSGYTAGASGH